MKDRNNGPPVCAGNNSISLVSIDGASGGHLGGGGNIGRARSGRVSDQPIA